jgi:hypothetical protein
VTKHFTIALLFLLSAAGQDRPLSRATTPPALVAVKEFHRNNLGIADVSTDGKLLLLETRVRSGRNKTASRVYAVEADKYREVSSIKVETLQDETYSTHMFFVPNSHKVILAGKAEKSKSKNTNELTIWTPETGAIQTISGVLDHQTFVLGPWDQDQILCYSASSPIEAKGRRFFLYNLSSGKTEAIDIRGDELRPEWDHPIVHTRDRRTVAGPATGTKTALAVREIGSATHWTADTSPAKIKNYSFSPDGQHLVIASVQQGVVTGTENGMRTLADIPFVSVYDTRTHLQIEKRRILSEVVPMLRKTRRVATAENYPKNSGSRLQFSNDGRWLVIGFDVAFDENEEQRAQFALYRFPSLELAGFAQHPAIKLGIFRHIGTTAIMSRLRFSADDRLLLTTSRYAIAWEIPSSGR